MINLLNPETQQSIKAGRLNIKLRRFLFALIVATLVSGVVYGFGFWYVSQQETLANQELEKARSSLKSYAKTIEDAEAYSANLKVAEKILGSQITYSDFLIETAKLMPPNIIISNLSLSTKTANSKTGTQIQARAKTADDALKLKTNLQQSAMFDDVRLVSVNRPASTTSSSGISATYPFQATLNVTIKNDGVKQ